MRATKTNSYTEGRVRKNKISPSTQQTDCGLRGRKTDSNVKSCAGHKEDSWDATDDDAEGRNQDGTSACSGQTPV